MELLLKKDVAGLGHTGDVVNVKPGYARNYLLPKDLATAVTPQARMELQAAAARRAKAVAAEAERLQAFRKQIESLSLTIVEKASEEGHLFGSVTAKSVLDAFTQAGGQLREEACEKIRQRLLDETDITEEQLNELEAWMESRPELQTEEFKEWMESRPDVPFQFGPRNHGGIKPFGGFGGPHGGFRFFGPPCEPPAEE